MPELPEVEVTRLGLLDRLPGRLVQVVNWSGQRLRGLMPRKLLQEEIAGQRIRTVDRRAKYLLLRMESGAVLVLHLGMTGKLGLMATAVPRHKHDHLVLSLEGDLDMRLNDSRRFGFVGVWPAATAVRLEKEFSDRQGLEPFGPRFTAVNLHALAQRRSIPVKTFLMHGDIVAGIGNIYANEILFAARIHPLTTVSLLTPADWRRIVKYTHSILKKAIAAGGSSISDFLGTSGHPGYFQLQLQVYGRKGEACPRCAATIVKIDISGRSAFYCPHCQGRKA